MLGYKKFICNECDAIIYLKNIAYQKAINQAKKTKNKETGGILIGRYSSSLKIVYINELSNPPADSKAGFCWFNRGVKGLREYLEKKWIQNEEYYLGEWHFHPANVPEPSLTDIAQLKRISWDKRFNCKEPILIIVLKNNIEYSINMSLLLGSCIYKFIQSES